MIKNIKNYIFYAILIIAICLLGWQNYNQRQMIDEQTVQLTSKNTDDNKTTVIFYEQKLETLKKTNKELYDSLKIYKDEIDYLTQFKFNKEYIVHDTIIKKDTVNDNENIDVKEFTYKNKEKNDTLNYELKIGSIAEPNWYSIKFQISEQFTIVNKEKNGINETTIAPTSNNATITNVTILKQKEKFKLKDKIAIGPSISGGYCIINKKFDIMLGVSVTWDLW